MLKLKLLFKNLSRLKVVGWQMNGFCKAIEVIRGGYVTNWATRLVPVELVFSGVEERGGGITISAPRYWGCGDKRSATNLQFPEFPPNGSTGSPAGN